MAPVGSRVRKLPHLWQHQRSMANGELTCALVHCTHARTHTRTHTHTFLCASLHTHTHTRTHTHTYRYLPWADEDVHEDFTNGMFTDSAGHLKLSASQIKAPFKRWQRAAELTEYPKMIDKITPQSIRQTVRVPGRIHACTRLTLASLHCAHHCFFAYYVTHVTRAIGSVLYALADLLRVARPLARAHLAPC